MKYILLAVLLLGCITSVSSQRPGSGLFVDPHPPGNTPVLFAAGIVSDGMQNRDMAIAPDGKEIFYTIQHNPAGISVIMQSRFTAGRWTKPEVASFSGSWSDLEPAFSPDGKKLYFVSNRPANDTGSAKDFDIWYLTKKNGEWTDPVRLPWPVNTEQDEFYPSLTLSGNIYFTRTMTGKKEDIVFCRWQNGKYQPAESLPEAVNSMGYEFNAFIDPAEQYILFTAYGRKDDLGKGDLYLSYKDQQQQWQPATHLFINSEGIDYCPYVSPDGQYLFFTSARAEKIKSRQKKIRYSDLKKTVTQARNGSEDIYWMRRDAVIKGLPNAPLY
jgi:Tol biopolymer transport system component